MAEVVVYCAECGTALEEYKVKIDYGSFAIDIIPCDCLLEDYKAHEPNDYE